jgi:hypothetical protein
MYNFTAGNKGRQVIIDRMNAARRGTARRQRGKDNPITKEDLVRIARGEVIDPAAARSRVRLEASISKSDP